MRRRAATGSGRCAGTSTLDEVERALGVDLPAGDYETIAGLVIAAHGGLPGRGRRLRLELPADPGEVVQTTTRPARCWCGS